MATETPNATLFAIVPEDLPHNVRLRLDRDVPKFLDWAMGEAKDNDDPRETRRMRRLKAQLERQGVVFAYFDPKRDSLEAVIQAGIEQAGGKAPEQSIN
jgi:hypothetical protein